MTLWSDFFKLFTYANEKDPLTKTKDASKFSGAGISQADALQTGGELVAGQGPSNYVNLRQTYDMIDTTTLGNRSMRYKEYERLRNLPEIEMAMTVFADEACVAGDTKIATPFGFQTIESLVKDKSDERFLVYCYDLEKSDYTLGWAYAPRLVRKAKTIKIVLDNGKTITATHDHRVLKRNGEWTTCGELRFGDELMPFYRIPANQNHNDLKSNLFPRLYSFEKGWVHERQFIDDWKNGKTSPEYEKVNRAARLICGDISVRQIAKIMDHDWNTVENWMHKNGFTLKELRHLAKNKTVRKVVGVSEGPETEVYDISVEKHKCFATDSVILHNCQKNDDGNVLKIDCRNDDIRKELEFLLLNRKMLNINRYAYVYFKDMIVHGDKFFEVVINPDNPSEGIYKLVPLPVDTMYRIETIKGRLVEFQQSKEGPDYQSIARGDVSQMSDAELAQSTAIRFAPTQVLHIRIGDDRKNFYPYGQSLIEPARGPAHQLRLMEDAMVVYRLVRAPERRVFYIDVGQLPPFKAEAFIERLKDQFRKRKTANNRGSVGANMVEERWQPPAQDEDFWIPTRPNANSRIETLPGACLSLDTEIPLLDGRTLPLSKIISEVESGNKLWVYSIDPKTGVSAPGRVSWAGVTRKNTQVVRVTFDNGESVVCTPDHNFPTQNRGKVEAKDLVAGDSLFPHKTRLENLSSGWKTKYEQVYDSATRKWTFTHRMVVKGVKGTQFSQDMVYCEEHQNKKKTIIHHINYDHFNNSPENLSLMNWDDHKLLHRDNQHITNANISSSLKAHHENLNPEQIRIRDEKLVLLSGKGSDKLQKLMQDEEFRTKFRKAQVDGWKDANILRPEIHKTRGNKIAKRNKIFWSDPIKKKAAFDKQKIVLPEHLWERFVTDIKSGNSVAKFLQNFNADCKALSDLVSANTHLIRKSIDLSKGLSLYQLQRIIKYRDMKTISAIRTGVTPDTKNDTGEIVWTNDLWNFFLAEIRDGKSAEAVLSEINTQDNLLSGFAKANAGNYGTKFRFKGKLTMFYIKQMVRSKGYADTRHLKREAANYNHKVVSVEWLPDYIDTGTITVDGDELVHNHHTFALSRCGVYTYNSNLGEIDDALYFRNKLFIALNFPKNYFSSEDVNATRITLSAQDVKFARMIERLQSNFEDAMIDLCERHLELRGYPQEMYHDLKVKMTPPSDWRELSRAEVRTARFTNAGALKSGMLMSDYDIYTRILMYSDEDTSMMLSRLKLQKLEDLKIQIMSQNPQLLGVGVPNQQSPDTEVGAEAGGPTPELAAGGAPPEGAPPEGSPEGAPPGAPPEDTDEKSKPGDSASEVPIPSEDDIKKYNMEIKDYRTDMDYEDKDTSYLS